MSKRGYVSYTQDDLQKALDDISRGIKSEKQASDDYGIPRGTLYNRRKGLHGKKIGRPTDIMPDEEEAIVEYLCTAAAWGFPFDLFDLRCVVKAYLDSSDRRDNRFKNNFPSPDWARSFIQRYRSRLGQRVAESLAPSRASVSPEQISAYFENVNETLSGVPPSNIFNFDETNVSDSSKPKRVICPKGSKHARLVRPSSKAATTIMFCGSADGTLLPPYVVYKAAFCYSSWTIGGPKKEPCCAQRCCKAGARFTATSHGWMETTTMENWIEKSFVPHAQLLEGKKVLICDNLSSHFSGRIIDLCRANNIQFVCLPPNSTHLTQPLDLAFFRPFKDAWRKVLEDYRRQEGVRTFINKKDFPKVLKDALNVMGEKSKAALQNGFRQAGLYPLSAEAVLKHLPQMMSDSDRGRISDAFQQQLNTIRYPQKQHVSSRGRGLGRKVAPGLSLTADVSESSSSDEEQPIASTSGTTSGSGSRPLSTASSEYSHISLPTNVLSVKFNQYVAIGYDRKWYLAVVNDVRTGSTCPEFYLKFMLPYGPATDFHWPGNNYEEGWFGLEDIICTLHDQPMPIAGGRKFKILEDEMDEIDAAFAQKLGLK